MQAVVATALPPSVIASVNTASLASVTSGDGFQLALQAVQAVAGQSAAATSLADSSRLRPPAPSVDSAEQTAVGFEVANPPNPSPAGSVAVAGLARRTQTGRKSVAKEDTAGNTDATLSAPAEVARATKPPLNDLGSGALSDLSIPATTGEATMPAVAVGNGSPLTPAADVGVRRTRDVASRQQDPLPSGPEPMGRSAATPTMPWGTVAKEVSAGRSARSPTAVSAAAAGPTLPSQTIYPAGPAPDLVPAPGPAISGADLGSASSGQASLGRAVSTPASSDSNTRNRPASAHADATVSGIVRRDSVTSGPFVSDPTATGRPGPTRMASTRTASAPLAQTLTARATAAADRTASTRATSSPAAAVSPPWAPATSVSAASTPATPAAATFPAWDSATTVPMTSSPMAEIPTPWAPATTLPAASSRTATTPPASSPTTPMPSTSAPAARTGLASARTAPGAPVAAGPDADVMTSVPAAPGTTRQTPTNSASTSPPPAGLCFRNVDAHRFGSHWPPPPLPPPHCRRPHCRHLNRQRAGKARRDGFCRFRSVRRRVRHLGSRRLNHCRPDACAVLSAVLRVCPRCVSVGLACDYRFSERRA